MANRWVNNENSEKFYFLGFQITVDGDCHHVIKRCLLLGRKTMKNIDSRLKRRDIANKGPYNQRYVFSSSYVWMQELDHKEGWALKNWCFWTVVLKKALESPLDSKEIQPVNPKGNQPWIFIWKIDAEAEAPILCPPDGKNWLTGKDPNARKDWQQKEKRVTEFEMVRQHHQFNEHEFEQTPGDSKGQGSLACHSLWGHKEMDMT